MCRYGLYAQETTAPYARMKRARSKNYSIPFLFPSFSSPGTWERALPSEGPQEEGKITSDTLLLGLAPRIVKHHL